MWPQAPLRCYPGSRSLIVSRSWRYTDLISGDILLLILISSRLCVVAGVPGFLTDLPPTFPPSSFTRGRGFSRGRGPQRTVFLALGRRLASGIRYPPPPIARVSRALARVAPGRPRVRYALSWGGPGPRFPSPRCRIPGSRHRTVSPCRGRDARRSGLLRQ